MPQSSEGPRALKPEDLRKPADKVIRPSTARPTATAPRHRDIKIFHVEFSAQREGAIPAGWVPFAVHALPGATLQALIYAYKRRALRRRGLGACSGRC